MRCCDLENQQLTPHLPARTVVPRWVSHERSISSNVRPLVSGTTRHTKRNAAIAIIAYSRKARGAVSQLASERNVNVTSSLPHQRQTVASDIARRRTRLGQTSDSLPEAPV